MRSNFDVTRKQQLSHVFLRLSWRRKLVLGRASKVTLLQLIINYLEIRMTDIILRRTIVAIYVRVEIFLPLSTSMFNLL